jgi:ABC-type multidrug transport system fused ATPase/permease subunit
MSLFGGIGVIALVSKLSGNENLILIYLTIFLFSASRMIPSLLRTQYYTGVLQKSTEQSNKIFEILGANPSDSENIESTLIGNKVNGTDQLFLPALNIKDLTFSYSADKSNPTICEVSLKVSPGETVAIVGDSGAGKSTLVDLLLGYLLPDSGNVTISGLDPRTSFEVWPGKVSYVPQKVTIYEGTLFDNIAIGIAGESKSYHQDKVWDLLQGVGLGSFAQSLKNGLDAQLSEFGSNLSGGQVQRIGIARALFSDPQLIVFDESTSSLDSASEKTIMDYLYSFKGDKTLILVAHRLSSIRRADKIFYLKQGELVAEGTFENLRDNFSDFNQQILLQNIDDTSS